MSTLILGPIIGGLSHEKGFLWGRADGTGILYAWLGKKPDLSDGYLAGQSLPLRSEDGFCGVAPIKDLVSNTRYHYHLSLENLPPKKHAGPLPGGIYPSFKTFPKPGERISFSFAFGSCFRPKVPTGGKIFHSLEARRLVDDIRFILMIGDQIYADDHRYNSVGRTAFSVEDYRQVYLNNWSVPSLRRLLMNLPAFMILDDHEVDDDWRWLDPLRQKVYIPFWNVICRKIRNCFPQEIEASPLKVRNALQAYWEHQAMHAPSFEQPFEIDSKGQYTLSPQDAGSLAYTFTYGAAAFFVLDTRTMRVRSLLPWSKKSDTILGEQQWQALETWLRKVKDDYPVKFIVTSSALLFNLIFDFPRDRWSGFRRERKKMLSLLSSMNVRGVYFIAGDLHSSHAVKAELLGKDGKLIPTWEFCSSPFEQDTNFLARYLYRPLRDAPVKKQECRFIVAKNNFGLVKVKFDSKKDVQVKFELYGEEGELLALTG